MQRVFFRVAPDPADADIDPVRLAQRMLHLLEGRVLPRLQIASQLIFDGIEYGRSATVVLKGTETVKTLLFKQAQPIGDGIPAHAAQFRDLGVLFSEILEFDAQETAKNLGVALVLLTLAQFFLLSERETNLKSHGEKMESDSMVQIRNY